MTPPLTRRPSTPDDLSIPHSGMCDIDQLTYARDSDGLTRWVRQECTCGAGLVRLVVGK